MGDQVGQRGDLTGAGDLQSNKGLLAINGVVTLLPVARGKRSYRQKTRPHLKE